MHLGNLIVRSESCVVRLIGRSLGVLVWASCANLTNAQTTSGELREDPIAARTALQKAVTAYQQYTSFSSRTEMDVDYEMEPKPPETDPQRTWTSTIEFVAPNRFRAAMTPYVVISDGQKVYVHNQETNNYMESTLDELGPWLPEWITENTDRAFKLPSTLRAMIDSRAELDDVFPAIARYIGVRPEVIAGHSGQWVVADFYDDTYHSGEFIRTSLWIDDQSHLIKLVKSDCQSAYQASLNSQREQAVQARKRAGMADEGASAPEWKVNRMVWNTRVLNSNANPAIPEDTFTFKPGPDDRKVESFSARFAATSKRVDQAKLIGQNAPDFTGPKLDGESLSLADLKGRVVLLDFWATWCGPCVQAIPHVQSISAHFDGKPVTVLGINRDRPGDSAKVKKFVNDKNITFEHVLDESGSIAQRYHVTGIPCTVLIDQKGVVQTIHTGFAPSHRDEFIEKIGRLLDGEQVLDADDLAAQIDVAKRADEQREEQEKQFERQMRFGMDASPELLKLIVQKAPDFEGKDFEGKPIKLGDLSGKIVVLYFWMASGLDEEDDAERRFRTFPERYQRSIQRVVRRMSDKNVVALGVPRHFGSATPEDAREWLEKHDITTAQIVDEEGNIQDLYPVRSYPTRILIDKEGIVRDVAVGQRTSLELELSKEIETIAGGGSLVDAQELNERLEAAAETAKQWPDTIGAEPMTVATAAPDQLALLKRWNDESVGHRAITADIDNDGEPETVVYGGQSLGILKGNGSELQRVRLKTGGKANCQINEVLPVTFDGQLCWFASLMSWAEDDLGSWAALYNASGDELWKFEAPKADVKLEEGERLSIQPNIAAADLDGDDREELLILANYLQWSKPDGDREFGSVGHHSAAHLFILDSKGKIQSQTDLGESAHLLHVIRSSDDKRGTIVCGMTNGLRLFEYGAANAKPSSSKRSDAEPKRNPIFDERPYAQAKEAAEADGKWFIVKATATWCGPCRRMEQTTWREEKVTQWLQANAVAVSLDVDKQPDISKSLKVQAMPTVIAFKEGKEFDRVVGFQDAPSFLGWLTGMEQGKKSIEAFEEAARSRDDDADKVDGQARYQLAQKLSQSGRLDEAADEYVWLWQNMLKHDRAMYGVRLSFMANDMTRLAEQHPAAKKRFAALRDETEKRVNGDKVSRDDLIDWVCLNRIIKDEDQILAWFDRVKDDPRWHRMFDYVSRDLQQLLIERERWVDLGKMYPDPMSALNKELEMRAMLRKMPDRGLDEALRKEAKAVQDVEFRRKVASIHAGLLAAERDEQASSFAAKVREHDKEPAAAYALIEMALKANQPRREHVDWLEGADEPEAVELRKRIEAELK